MAPLVQGGRRPPKVPYGLRCPDVASLDLFVLFLIAGTCIFWQRSTVRPKASVTSDDRVAVGTAGELSTSSPVEEQRSSESTWHTIGPFAYSLDLFPPLVNLRYDERWEPADQLRLGYVLLHAMAGWLLVPLLVASLAGIVRRQ